jgi:aquaporin Z
MQGVDVRKVAAETVGTFVFFLIGFMAVLSTLAGGAPDLVVIAFGFGLGLFVAIAIAGAVSGGHFNPAVTIGALLDGRIDVVNATAYIIAQLVGGIVAAVGVMVVFDQSAVASTITKPGNGITDIEAILIEAVFTAIFVAVILTVTKRAPNHAVFVIPITLLVIHLALVPFTGSSVNPARSIASALVGNDLNAIWIYIVGPVIGAAVGWGFFRYLTPEGGATT